jgi:hypothetical protein
MSQFGMPCNLQVVGSIQTLKSKCKTDFITFLKRIKASGQQAFLGYRKYVNLKYDNLLYSGLFVINLDTIKHYMHKSYGIHKKHTLLKKRRTCNEKNCAFKLASYCYFKQLTSKHAELPTMRFND